MVQPLLVGPCAVFLRKVGLSVGPFGGQDPVDAFDFPVGLRPVRVGALVCDFWSECCSESMRAVSEPVIGEYPRDGDVVGGDVRGSAGPELGQ